MIRKTLAKTGIYQFFNFLSHVVFKKPRTVEEYNTLVAGNYLRKWQGKILIATKTTNQKQLEKDRII